MRHRVKTKKLNRHSSARKGLEYSLLVSLIQNKSIQTTLPKAKYIKPKVERLVTKAKRGDTLENRRLLLKKLRNNKKVVELLLSDYATKYAKHSGGYTRIRRTTKRDGDNAQMAILSFVETQAVEEQKLEPKSSKKTSSKPKSDAKKVEKKDQKKNTKSSSKK